MIMGCVYLLLAQVSEQKQYWLFTLQQKNFWLRHDLTCVREDKTYLSFENSTQKLSRSDKNLHPLII